MEKWLSGRKRFFAKEVSLKRVPWVQIPSSPPSFKTRETLAGFFVRSSRIGDDYFANKRIQLGCGRAAKEPLSKHTHFSLL